MVLSGKETGMKELSNRAQERKYTTKYDKWFAKRELPDAKDTPLGMPRQKTVFERLIRKVGRKR